MFLLVLDSAQPNMIFSASPFPHITSRTNVTLTCEGVSKFPDKGYYITQINFYQDNKKIHSCSSRDYDQTPFSFSCNVTVTNIKSRDLFECVVQISYGACNSNILQFNVKGKLLDKDYLNYHAIKGHALHKHL